MRATLDVTDHRPWPRPSGSWIMRQTWADLLFAHWRVPADAVASRLPRGLQLDTFEGQAWLGVVPFRMAWVRPRFVPALPRLSFFPELNVRTYVTDGQKAGVWFFSLDARSAFAVKLARAWFHLPYFKARMQCRRRGDQVAYRSERTHRGAASARFEARYGPSGPVAPALPGTLDHWLTERYCLYAAGSDDVLLRGEIHHRPWPLRPAWAEFEVNEMASCHGFALPDEAPLLHFVDRIDVPVWRPQRLPSAPR